MVSIEKSKNGQFYARVTGGNNEKLMRSETVKTKQSAKKNLKAVYEQLHKIFGENGSCIILYNKPKPKKLGKTNMIL